MFSKRSLRLQKPAAIKKYLCGFDTFIRHCCIADLAKDFNPGAILDVGGEGFLASFIKVPLINVNVKSADVQYAGVLLPFKENAIDVVVSCDTLEHLAKKDRFVFISELLRVSRKGVVLCAPLGTPEHIEAEKTIVKEYQLDKEVKHYLEEHIFQGLPTPAEVKEIGCHFSCRIFFQGDFRTVTNGASGRLTAYLKAAKQACSNGLTELFWNRKKHLSNSHTHFTNRFFLVVHKKG